MEGSLSFPTTSHELGRTTTLFTKTTGSKCESTYRDHGCHVHQACGVEAPLFDLRKFTATNRTRSPSIATTTNTSGFRCTKCGYDVQQTCRVEKPISDPRKSSKACSTTYIPSAGFANYTCGRNRRECAKYV